MLFLVSMYRVSVEYDTSCNMMQVELVIKREKNPTVSPINVV